MQLQPYIFFYGRCEEALEFYKSVLGGSFEMMRHGDSPMADQVSPEFRNKVMHASFKAGDAAFMASDGASAKSIDPEAGNISVSLTATDRVEGERVFNALSQGGNVKVPFDDAFWGGKFGMLDDRFGIEWMITAP
ncbi:VOC family protein [bacterium]|nr:MAG: VOC family protein [bacterium]